MDEPKLLPCPFCGGEARKRVAFPCDADGLEMNLYIVGCETCGIEFSWLWDEEAAVELWNTRKPMDDIVKKLEAERDKTDFVETSRPQRQYVYGNSYRPLFDTAIEIVRKGGDADG